MPSDTHPDAERVQIELLRQTTGAEGRPVAVADIVGDWALTAGHCQSESAIGPARSQHPVD